MKRTNSYVLTLAGVATGVGLISTVAFATDSTPPVVGSQMELHLLENGHITLRGAKVMSISGSTITARTAKGAYRFDWTINTDNSTEFFRRFLGRTALGEIDDGDFISVAGMFDFSNAHPTIQARIVQDWSIQQARANFSGMIKLIATSTQSFVLSTSRSGDITVNVASTTKILKGNNVISFNNLHTDDRVESTAGTYNNLARTLDATKIRVSEHHPVHHRKVFQGIVQSLGGSTLPSTLVVRIGNQDFMVKVAIDTTLLNVHWAHIGFGDIKVGDRVRIYGGVLLDDNTVIDATVLRDVRSQ